MPFERFFRELEGTNNTNNKEKILCRCRETEKGYLSLSPQGNLSFFNNCDSSKACFKIRFDSKKLLSIREDLQPTDKKRKKGKQQSTLDEFFKLDLNSNAQDA
ncbi:hypothetical protein [Candidatus Hodarchaeum mangrovi]